ncbi:hypothetical protein HGM15179_010791 [Zosterops borbonicus]|uniref:CCHC-type domain-containing protein n=1 Tax=Zosterops borbonicus TaxID=364589 RepID=A0A8K1GDY8_9PASS|nr:hypothetical protein HGM15179_010791 [Zosterops borbonicus]
MVEVCVKHTFTENIVAQVVAEGIAEGVSGAFAIVAAKDNQSCFNCGYFGHFLKDCPKRLSLENNEKDHYWLCANPNKWWQSGNGQQSMGWPHMMTSNGRPLPPTVPTSTSGEERKKKDQKIPPEMQKIQHTPRHRQEPAANW